MLWLENVCSNSGPSGPQWCAIRITVFWSLYSTW